MLTYNKIVLRRHLFSSQSSRATKINNFTVSFLDSCGRIPHVAYGFVKKFYTFNLSDCNAYHVAIIALVTLCECEKLNIPFSVHVQPYKELLCADYVGYKATDSKLAISTEDITMKMFDVNDALTNVHDNL